MTFKYFPYFLLYSRQTLCRISPTTKCVSSQDYIMQRTFLFTSSSGFRAFVDAFLKNNYQSTSCPLSHTYIQPVVDGLPFYFHHSIFLFFIVQQTISLCIERNIQYDWMSQNKRVGKKERIIKTRNDKTGRRVISSRTSASLLSLSLHVCIYIFIFKTYDILIGPPGEVLNNWIEDIFIFFFYMSAFDQSNLSKLSAFAQEEWQNSLQGHWITSFVDLCFVEDRTLD
jgi:hypothetical protein